MPQGRSCFHQKLPAKFNFSEVLEAMARPAGSSIASLPCTSSQCKSSTRSAPKWPHWPWRNCGCEGLDWTCPQKLGQVRYIEIFPQILKDTQRNYTVYVYKQHEIMNDTERSGKNWFAAIYKYCTSCPRDGTPSSAWFRATNINQRKPWIYRKFCLGEGP